MRPVAIQFVTSTARPEPTSKARTFTITSNERELCCCSGVFMQLTLVLTGGGPSETSESLERVGGPTFGEAQGSATVSFCVKINFLLSCFALSAYCRTNDPSSAPAATCPP